MATRMELLQEAQRRGLQIGERDQQLLAEASRRGLIAGPGVTAPQPRPQPTQGQPAAPQGAPSPDGEEPPPLEIDVTGGTYGAAPTQSEMEQLRANSPGYEGMTVAQPNPANQSDFARMVSGQPKQEEGNDVGRFLGKFGARQVLQGGYGLYGAMGGDALNHYALDPLDKLLGTQGTNLALGTGGRTYREMASDFADSQGMHAPNNKSERVISDIGEGLTGTALTMGAGGILNLLRNGTTAAPTVIAQQGAASTAAPGASAKLAQLLTAQPKLQAVSTATGAGAQALTRENGGSEGAQLLAGLGGGVTPGALATLSGAATRGALRGTSGQTMRDNIEAYNAVGATPSAGQAASNKRLTGLETLLAGGPTSTGVMARFGADQSEQIGTGLQRLSEGFSRGASGERAGRAVEEGVKAFSKGIADSRNKLYAAVDAEIPPTTKVPMSNTRATLDSLTAIPAGAPNTGKAFINGEFRALAEDIRKDLAASSTRGQFGSLSPQSEGIDYETVRAIRTRIGQELEDFSLSTDKPTRQYKALYAALSRDIETAAAAQGPKAAAAANRASLFYKVSDKRLEALERVVDKNGGPENVYKAVMQGTRDGGTTLRTVMQSLPKEGQQALTGAVIRRMGLANAGVQDEAGQVFSSATFLTNWNKVSDEAKRALFDRHGPQFARNMDRIAKVASNVKQNATTFANGPGTARTALAYGYVLALAQSLATGRLDMFGNLVAGGVGANLMARAFTNPKFVGWLAHATELPKGAIPTQIALLGRVAEESNDAELKEIAEALKGAEERQQQADRNPLLKSAAGQ